jgi:deoxyribonuclease-4
VHPRSSVPPIGAHIQIKGGLAKGGLPYADAVGAAAAQVFVGNPRGWKLTAGDPAQDALFTAGCTERGIPSFVHTPFLVNVGSPTQATVEQSIASIAHNLARATQLGCEGVVVHAGSAVGEDRYEAALRQLRERLLPVLDGLPQPSRNSAPTSTRSTSTRCWGSASTPATSGPLGTTWPPRAG